MSKLKGKEGVFLLSVAERRSRCLRLAELLQAIEPSPQDYAALGATLAEITRESVAHVMDVEGCSREKFLTALDGITAFERAAALDTTRVRESAIRSGVS